LQIIDRFSLILQIIEPILAKQGFCYISFSLILDQWVIL